jgi:hypothetical protein
MFKNEMKWKKGSVGLENRKNINWLNCIMISGSALIFLSNWLINYGTKVYFGHSKCIFLGPINIFNWSELGKADKVLNSFDTFSINFCIYFCKGEVSFPRFSDFGFIHRNNFVLGGLLIYGCRWPLRDCASHGLTVVVSRSF